ncbi:MAG: hypothetical protein R6X12_04215 [bacterium]
MDCPHRTILSAAHRLSDRAHALGLPRRPVGWLPEEELLLNAYARAVVHKEYPNAGQAARALARDLAELAAGRKEANPSPPRSYQAVHTMLWARARKLGRPFLALRWAPEEMALARRYVRELTLGRFRNAWDAAVLCSAELDRLRHKYPDTRWAGMRRTTLATWAQIWQEADRLGLTWTESLWTPAEARIVDRYAREVAPGRYRSARAAAPDCWRELARFHRVRRRRKLKDRGEPGPRTLRAVCGKLEVRVRGLRQGNARAVGSSVAES